MGIKKYTLNTWRNGRVRVTANELYRRVKSDSKSNYNWIASATDLVRVCKMKGFPEDIAEKIQDLILNCFAELSVRNIYKDSNQKSTDERAVWYCYHNSKNEELKDYFVEQNVKRAILLCYGDSGRAFHGGPKHDEFEKRFTDKMAHEIRRKDRYVYDEKSEKNLIDEYITWRKSLTEKYSEAYEAAEDRGDFGDERRIFTGDISNAMKYFKLVNLHEVTLNE